MLQSQMSRVPDYVGMAEGGHVISPSWLGFCLWLKGRKCSNSLCGVRVQGHRPLRKLPKADPIVVQKGILWSKETRGG